MTAGASSSVPDHFNSSLSEERWNNHWQRSGIYQYNPLKPKSETFIVDTPPPTVSGSLHIGHIFSYTQTDVIVRYQRMKGRNIFYPIGWDDNGLPTERRVQNYFNVRCSINEPYEEGLTAYFLNQPNTERTPRIISRQNFIELCLHLTKEDEKAFKYLWQRIGLSVDWNQEYSTIDNLSRHVAQLSFLDLYEKGYVYNAEFPTMWDVDFQTAVAQAEVEDRLIAGALHEIRFPILGTKEFVTIATTRPELLPSCIGLAAHPQDNRYKNVLGRFATTPLFGVSIPIFADLSVDPEKGTGIMMICCFGDASDVLLWRENRLPLRQIIGRDGRFLPVSFGTENWHSVEPEAANRFYKELAGKSVHEGRKTIVDLLNHVTNPGDHCSYLIGVPKPIQHSVKFFEKGDKPLEIISTRQWFVRLLDKKDELIRIGESLSWYPDHMRLRFRNWVENLQQDWCISRQRYFGVPFPVWYLVDGNGNVRRDAPLLASTQDLPVDPVQFAAPRMNDALRGKPEGFVPETDVFDTWFTSSMTPFISSHWLLSTLIGI